MIAKIVNGIDDCIKKKFDTYPCLCVSRFYGLAEPVVRRMSSDEAFPAIVDFDGEDTEVFADDDFPVGIYHRLLTKQYLTPIVKKQYGDQITQDVEGNMILVCWAFRNQVAATADILESIIYSCFTREVLAGVSNFDRRSVFSSEFSGVPFFLPEDVMLFSMKYKFKYPATARECLDIPNFCN